MNNKLNNVTFNKFSLFSLLIFGCWLTINSLGSCSTSTPVTVPVPTSTLVTMTPMIMTPTTMSPTTNYVFTPTIIPTSIASLTIVKGNVNANKVLIYVQGGPGVTLTATDLNEITTDTVNFTHVYVHQAQTIDPNYTTTEISFEQAIKANAVTIEILSKVIDYYKDTLKKKVYLFGSSYGAFVVPEYIATRTSTADIKPDGIGIAVGRLDMPEIVWKGFSNAQFYSFTDGVTPILNSNPSPTIVQKNTLKIAAGVGMNRYTTLLADKDLTKVVYIFGTLDNATGRLSAAEEAFLISKKVKVIKGEGQ